MKLPSTDIAAWRAAQFPFFVHKICLTHASVSPLPAHTRDAVKSYLDRISWQGQFDFVHDDIYHRCKERLARLIGHGARADEIGFAGSTSHALGIVATGIDWKPGDNCVVADGDFPANVVTWKNLEHTHGVEVRLIPHRPCMDIGVDDIAPLVDARTRIVSLATANFLSGYAIDCAAIGKWLHERGVLFCVDAIQTLGAVAFDAEHVDFLCADAHKWLLGPNGIALLWARQGALEQIRPAILGWLATKGRDDWYAYDTEPIASGERFEPGARNMLGVVALDASLELLEATGKGEIESRVTHLRNYAAHQLQEADCDLLWDPNSFRIPHSEIRNVSGIVSFQPRHGQTADLYKHLDRHFALSLRNDRAGAEWIRVSAHYMNTEEDLDNLATSITEFRAG